MAEVYEEFEREMARLHSRYAGRPRRELIHLLLLALEREELVSIGYRESLMRRRLQAMPIADPVREIIHHALVWIWRDEQMHAVYVRGALFKLGSQYLRFRAALAQAAGGIGGWASSALQHTRWRQAPLSHTLAWLVTAGGFVFGKVPPDVRKHLEHGPFRNFCLFNIEAEMTAALCWGRLVELASSQADVRPELVHDFRRIVTDENRHRRIFEILAAALDNQDRLVEQETADTLVEKFGEVGRFFLPRARRGLAAVENPIGSGGRVWRLQGASPADKLPLFRRLLEESGLAARLDERACLLNKPRAAMRVAIKPSFMLGYHRRDPSPVTDPALLDQLAGYLRELGCGDVAAIEGPNIYDNFYNNRTVVEVARYFGVCSPHFRLVDASQEQVAHSYFRGMGQYTVARTWKEADFRISFSKLRSHPIELALLSLGNVEWLGARCEQFVFIERQAHRETAIMMLLDEFPPHFALLEGYETAPDGLVGMMGCTRPKSLRQFYAGADALAVDMVAARHLGVKDPHESSILRAACHWFGGWSQQIELIGDDQPIPGWRGPYHNELSALLSLIAYPVYQMASGRGVLFTPAMDEQAFPPLQPEGPLLRLGRRGVRALLGLPALRSKHVAE